MLTTAVIGVVVGVSSPVLDGWDALRGEHIAADCGTIVHMDFAHSATTELGRGLLAELAEPGDEADIFAEFTTDMGIEIGRDITGLTIYQMGTGLGAHLDADELKVTVDRGDRAVLLVYGTEALHRWDEVLEAEQDDTSPDFIAGRPVREINRGEEHWSGVMLPDGEGVVWVVAPSVEVLGGAVEVMDGRGARADVSSWPVAGPAEGSFLFVAVRDFADIEEWTRDSEVLDRAEGFSLSIGEADGEGFVRLEVTADSDKDALAIAGVCQGLLGMAQLTLGDKEELRPLIRLAQMVRVQARGARITAEVEEDADELLEMLRALSGSGED